MSTDSTRRPRATRRLRATGTLTAAALAASVAGILTAGAGSAGAAPAAPSAPEACGYYEAGDTGYFGNCSGEDVTVEIDDWGPNSYACVRARTVGNLGSAWDIDDAWVIHSGCN